MREEFRNIRKNCVFVSGIKCCTHKDNLDIKSRVSRGCLRRNARKCAEQFCPFNKEIIMFIKSEENEGEGK